MKNSVLEKPFSHDYQAVVLNMEHVNQSYPMLGQQPIDGVLGGDLLHELRL